MTLAGLNRRIRLKLSGSKLVKPLKKSINKLKGPKMLGFKWTIF